MDSDSQLSASDAELITRVRGGDRAAFGELYERHRSAAARVARQYARAAPEADDLVAESFAKVLDGLLAGRGPDTAFRAYLFTTIRNTAFDRTRKDARLQFTDDIAAHETPEMPVDPVLAGAESSLVARAFRSLPERWQTVLWHTEVERESPQQVGVLLGLSANAVTSLAFRAREGLRQAYLQAHLADTAAHGCRTTVARLGAWARDSLSRRERSEVEAHLSECERCRALAAELEEMNTSLRAVLAPVLLGGAALGYLAAAPPAEAAATTGAASVAGTGASGASGAAGATGAGGASAASDAVAASSPWWASGFAVASAAAGIVAAVVVGITVFTGGGDTATPPSPLMTPPVTAPPSSTTEAPPSSPSSAAPTEAAALSVTTAESTTAQASTTPVPSSSDPAPSESSAVTGGVISSTSSIAASTTPRTSTAPTTSKTKKTSKPTTTTSSPTSSSAAPSPAALTGPQLSASSISAPAGGSAAVSFTVTNSGDTDSGLETLTIAPPAGVDLAGTSMSMTPAFRSPAAAFARPGAQRRMADPVFTCASGSCTFLVPARSTLAVTLLFTIDAAASSGTIDLSTAAGSAAVTLEVRTAVLVLTLGTADTTFVSGGVLESAPLVGILAEGVGAAPPVTFPRTVGGLTFTPVSGSCTSTRATITCEAGKPGSGYYGDLRVTIAKDAIGPQPITATSGAASVAITAVGGAPIIVTRPPVAGPGS